MSQFINEFFINAKKAFDTWQNTSLNERIHILHQFKEVVHQNKDFLTYLISEEMKKPLWDSKAEVNSLIAKVDISIEAYFERTNAKKDGSLYIRHKPYGIVAVFGPFNFPAHLPNGHIIPALLAGNVILFKPSEKAVRVGQKIVELWKEAKLPDNVLQLLPSDVESARKVVADERLNGLFFTGSSTVGLKLSEQFAKTPGKILALEMGGNNPLLMWECNKEQEAIAAIIQSAFITSGQRCTCARRFIVKKGQDHFLHKLKEAAAKIKIGNFDDKEEPFMGPLISKEAADNLMQAQKKLISMGAKPILMMTQNEAFVTPGILNVSEITDLPDEEYFGPLLQVQEANHFNEALFLAFNTRFGLVASILTDKKDLYEQFLEQSKAGVVNWNAPTTGASSKAPFGGLGLSGNLRPSAYYAADYCAYPVASYENSILNAPIHLPGLFL